MNRKTPQTDQSLQGQDLFLTIPQAAKQLGLPVYAIRRAAKARHIPIHYPFSSRVRVRLSEVQAAIEAHDGGYRNE